MGITRKICLRLARLSPSHFFSLQHKNHRPLKKNEGPSSEQPGNRPSPPLVHLRKIRRVCCYRNPTWVVLVYRNEELGKKCEAQYLPPVSLIVLRSEPAASRSQKRAPKWTARFPHRKDDMHIYIYSFVAMTNNTPLTAN